MDAAHFGTRGRKAWEVEAMDRSKRRTPRGVVSRTQPRSYSVRPAPSRPAPTAAATLGEKSTAAAFSYASGHPWAP